MKASPQLIEMLTFGQVGGDEIAQVLGVSKPTVNRIIRAQGFQRETAMKIAKAFPYASAKQLFRRPFKPFEKWQQLLKNAMPGNGELSPETKRRLQRKHWKLSNPNRVKAHAKAYTQRKKMLERFSKTEGIGHAAEQQITEPVPVGTLAAALGTDKSNCFQILKRNKISIQKMARPTKGGIQMVSVISKEDADRIYQRVMVIKRRAVEWQPPHDLFAEDNGEQPNRVTP